MSSINLPNLARMSHESLAVLLTSPSAASKLAIVDYQLILVAGLDHIGGHIRSSIWVPSSELDVRTPELIRTLADKEKVVFHCALSQQRGPSAALRYARERQRLVPAAERQKQEVYVLEGGFSMWQAKYGADDRLTEGWVRDLWADGS